MRLQINGTIHDFTDLKTFRAEYDLPDTFGVSLFEPKDYTGLGRIDGAGAELNALREAVLARLPPSLNLQGWLQAVDDLQTFFWQQLAAINDVIGLREPEIDFAAAGFGDVCRAVVYALIAARAQHEAPPSFSQIYSDWLFSTVKVSAKIHDYAHQGSRWHVKVISHAYGRIGLIIYTEDVTHYVLDSRLACPAEGFMLHLLRDVAAHIMQRVL